MLKVEKVCNMLRKYVSQKFFLEYSRAKINISTHFEIFGPVGLFWPAGFCMIGPA